MNDEQNSWALREKDVQRRFDRAAKTINSADFVHRRAADGLFERMQPMQVTVNTAVDLGCATGKSSRELAKRFRGARVIGLDLSAGMLREAKSARSRFSQVREVRANASRLPFADDSIDLVFSNMLLPWINDLPASFAEIARVLRKDGLFSFSTLGPDSLAELHRTWSGLDSYQHVNRFADMHDLGDLLLQTGMRDPVLDIDHLSVQYRTVSSLFDDLTAAGARNSLAMRPPGLTGRRRFAEMKERLQGGTDKAQLELRLELVFGHAWGGEVPQGDADYRFDVSELGHRRR